MIPLTLDPFLLRETGPPSDCAKRVTAGSRHPRYLLLAGGGFTAGLEAEAVVTRPRRPRSAVGVLVPPKAVVHSPETGYIPDIEMIRIENIDETCDRMQRDVKCRFVIDNSRLSP
ncbi:hypothetical protein [Falsirhodobacter deserti]|uniref:hypothetical protein n=1 Tax=Falsirhodobacter deserti TaxID=1365611 RepID=UPI000FE3FCD6|nr:hypothetical protein [Falsirhodobacter deserti]